MNERLEIHIRPPKIVKRHQQDSDYIQRHELSLLALLVERHPERAKEFIARLSESMKAAA